MIDDRLPPILERLKARPEGVVEFLSRPQRRRAPNVMGPVQALKERSQEFGRKFLKGRATAALLFGQTGPLQNAPARFAERFVVP
ncbi:hypothetical protein HFP89_05575 [Wenzhouxiangella sp. XN79A]|uniref:hypothetical protein n=1 Tax=Wenzhouxiangella sp. XN79A TaxID=2724193 RepID=UPI00144ADAFB|nr:hypothetical protein [Wenzhouxiangella sp. XN79A]NKI34632.1 hypothetical protein [Wenzhouxiangella sp. XN79A]